MLTSNGSLAPSNITTSKTDTILLFTMWGTASQGFSAAATNFTDDVNLSSTVAYGCDIEHRFGVAAGTITSTGITLTGGTLTTASMLGM